MLIAVLAGLWKEVNAHKRIVAQLMLGVALVVFTAHALHSLRPVATTVQTVAPGVTSVEVAAPALTTRNVASTFANAADKAVVSTGLASLGRRSTATSVVVATSTATSTGGGKFTETQVVSTPPAEVAVETAGLVPAVPTPTPGPVFTGVHFTDWRLTFDADFATEKATYTLAQKFETVVTAGRTADGTPLATVQLYELGAEGERVPVPTVTTVGVFADQTAPHWLRKLAVQGGFGVTRASDGSIGKVGVVAAQWLKHGRTPDASEVLYAVLSPAVVLGPGVTDIGILPVSVNLGRIPHQPFTNLWLSPFVARSQRLGVFVTATF